MSKRRKRKSKPASDRITGNRRAAAEVKSENLKQQAWADLPVELLELILSRLIVVDNVRASVVCKRWHSVASSVRAADQSPWLMYFPKSDNCYDFYDPVQRKTYSLEFPELDECRVCYTKDGWLLLCREQWAIYHHFSLFNPFTRELIKLPRFERSYYNAAFSCAPTSAKCVILTVKHVNPTLVAISTCYPGANEWTTVNYQHRSVFVISIWDKLVFSNGLFYCLSPTGWLGVFDPLERTWSVLEIPPPKCLVENFITKDWRKGKFITAHEGNIFVIHICCGEDPIIFKLDQTLMEWKEVKTLGGVTLFASFLSSHSRTYITGIMRNSVYFSKVRFYGKRCISFSLDEHRYYPNKQCHDWVERNAFDTIWIEPPKDFAGWM
ncbi:F-box/kelch-repeat protein At1g57790-like [Trifolium pratense]|uniref:F-box/kelch-repeat protein At1g57790-like n=1 Tax=Trifolium pratense TaxID=57577 RepID=UPI001E691D02|nr:F-box/kelch-repeat protein At1g57790-like [Trifolium pratense]XP_045795933.1 F-box/kelch-repeat protein At1g57790-like [Trifolium pratense]